MSYKFVTQLKHSDTFQTVETCDTKQSAIDSMIETLRMELEESGLCREVRIMKECSYCNDLCETWEECGCPESLDEAEQLQKDNADEAKSERQRGH